MDPYLTLLTKINSNLMTWNHKTPKKILGENLLDLGLGKSDFLDMTPKDRQQSKSKNKQVGLSQPKKPSAQKKNTHTHKKTTHKSKTKQKTTN